ncbi:MAG: DNA-deoxyinosine glycosylase [Eubacterium sp.]|nr:DNA-deoxyinosine glycosylase [Eubacterium sp.]
MKHHTIEPVFDSRSKILILGSFPSVKSREQGFFYGHPQNRFWRVLARVTGEPCPADIAEKKQLLLAHNIALWDVIASCEVEGSADSTIRDITVNDIPALLAQCPICAVFTNGKKADALYRRHLAAVTGMEAVCLPSTSPANAAWSEDALYDVWNKAISNYLKG